MSDSNVSQTETITVIEEWTRDSMVRYVHAKNGERIVLEHIENPAHPYVMFCGPETFNNRYWTYKANVDNQDYSSHCEHVPDWAYET